MSLQDVEKRVMASAQQEADEIVEKAEAEAKAELERRSARLRDEKERKVALAKGEADTGLETAVTTRRAECAMKILKTKNQVLDAVFDQAQQRMLKSEGIDYNAWLADQVRQAVGAGEGVLHCNERDRQTVEAVLGETGTDKVSLAPENASFQGGVLLVGPSFDVDLTLDSALTDLRQDMVVELAEKLFADVPPMGDAKSALEE